MTFTVLSLLNNRLEFDIFVRNLSLLYFVVTRFSFKFGFGILTHIIRHHRPAAKLQYDDYADNGNFGFLETIPQIFA